MKSVTRIFIDRDVDGKVLFQPTPCKDSKKVIKIKCPLCNYVVKYHKV